MPLLLSDEQRSVPVTPTKIWVVENEDLIDLTIKSHLFRLGLQLREQIHP